MIAAVESIIPRTIEKNLSRILDDFSIKIKETVNLGSNILFWDIERNKGGDENLPIILFLRNYLEQLEACSILIKNSFSEPTHILIRTALENFFYIEYLLEKDFERRSLSFLVWNAYREKAYYEKADGKSSAYKDLVETYKKDKIVSNFQPIVLPNIEKLKQQKNELLNLPIYKEVSAEYLKKKDKRNRPEWYSLFKGPNTIKELADHLKYPAFYKILYQSLSSSTHGTNIIQGKIVVDKNNSISIYQIRLPLNVEFLTNSCITLSFNLYHDFTSKRLPDKLNDVKNWYLALKPFLDSLKTQLIKIN
jgi:hypothetical protein